MTAKILPSAPAKAVHQTVGKYLIADGFPIVVDLQQSRGAWIAEAETGQRYLDFYSFFASLPLGFHHPLLHTQENADKLLSAALHKPANSDAYSAELATFLETFARHALKEPFDHLFFIEGGALAVENALKTAFDWKVRKNLAAGKGPRGCRILHFSQAFHGRSGYTLSLTNTLPVKTDYFPKFDWPRVTNPKLHFPLDGAEENRVASEEDRALEEIEAAFDKYPDDIAAIIIEPIQGEGGDNHFRPQFFHALRSVADREEALLIFDEVQTGFGITGRFWAYEHFGVIPDIVCFGKKSQVCGIMAGPRIDEVPENVFNVSSRINSTWGGGLADMVRCEIILEVMEKEGLVENAESVGRHLLGRLGEIAERFAPRISNVRGRGLLCAFDCTSREERDKLLEQTMKRKLLLLACGETSIRLRPALILSREEVDEACSRLADALSDTSGG